MKKLAKIILPVFVIALLVGVFAIVTAAADTVYFTVTDSSGKVTEYTENEFSAVGSLSDATVDLKRDVNWTKQLSVSVSGNTVLNLNGYTLAMNAQGSGSGKEGRFGIGADNTVFTVNGKGADGTVGKITSTKTASRFFGQKKGTVVTFNDVDFSVAGTLSDYRLGSISFNNCTVTSTGSGTVMSLGNYSGATVDYTLTNTHVYSSSTGYLFQHGRGDAAKAITSTLTFVGGSVNAPFAANLSKCITDNSDSTVMDQEKHTVLFDGVELRLPKATLFTAANGAVSNGYRFVASATANSILEMASPAIAITIPAGYVRAFIGVGLGYKVVTADQTCTVKYHDGDATPVNRVMLKGAEPGLVRPLVPTFYYDAEVNKLKADDYCEGWKDADGNLVTTVDSDMELYATKTSATAIWAGYSAEGHDVSKLVCYEVENRNIRDALSQADAPAYVYFYDDVEFKGTTNTVDLIEWSCTIDLNGYTLTMQTTSTASTKSDFSFRPTGEGVTLTFRNGNIVAENTKIAYPASKAALVVENCNIDAGTLLVDARGSDVTFTDCDILYRGVGYTVFTLANIDGTMTSVNTFKNVKITAAEGANASYLFSLSRNNANNKATLIAENVTSDLTYTKGSVIYFATSHTATLSVKDCSFDTGAGIPIFNMPNATSGMTFSASGISYDSPACMTGSKFGGLTAPAGVSAYNGKEGACYTFVNSGYQTENWSLMGNTFVSYTLSGVVPTCESAYVIVTDDKGVDSLRYIDPDWTKNNLGAAVADKTVDVTVTPGQLTPATYAVFSGEEVILISTSAEITESAFEALPADSTLVLYADVKLTDGDGDTVHYVPSGLTVDLNKQTLDLDSDNADTQIRFDFAEGADKGFTVLDGTLVSNHNYVYLTSSNTATYEDVVFDHKGTKSRCFDLRGGTLVLDRCTVTTEDTVFNVGYRGGTETIRMTDCNVTAAKDLLRCAPLTVDDDKPAYKPVVSISIIGGAINVGESLVDITNDKNCNPDPTTPITVTLGGVTVKADSLFSEGKPVTERFTLNGGCSFNVDPTAGIADLVYGKDTVLAEVEGSEYPYVTVDKAMLPAVRANLTLYTDFVLNFYLPASATSATVNGLPVELVAFDGGYKVQAGKVSATDVMDDFTLVYTCTFGEGSLTDSVTFSVCDYASAVLNGEYDASAKALIAGAVRYIHGAFGYAKEEHPAELIALIGLAGYTENVGELVQIPASSADYSALTEVIDSIQLALGDTLKYVINFKADYVGTVNINGVEVEVSGGSKKVVLRACDFNEGLTVKATVENGEVSGTYDLAAYYAAVKGDDAELDVLLVALYNYSAASAAYIKAAEQEEEKVFDGMQSVLMIGQSNMAGRGDLSYVDPISDDRIFMMRDGGWVRMQEPIHNDKPSAAACLGASFAKGFVDTYDCEIGLIPGAYGGSSLAQWQPGHSSGYYERALNMAKAAQQSSDICAILWHQGESDGSNTNYAAELKVILDSFIADLGLDASKVVIITGEIGEFRTETQKTNVNGALPTLADDYARYGVASAKGLLAQDVTTHFDAPSLRVFGYRYFAIFHKLITGETFLYNDDVESYRITPEVGGGDEEDDGISYVSNKDFNGENYVVGDYAGGTINGDKFALSNGKIAFYEKAGSAGDKYVGLERTASNAAPYADIVGAIDAKTVFVVEAKFMIDESFNAASELLKLVDGSTTIPLVYVKSNGELFDITASSPTDSLGKFLTYHEWTTVKVIVDLANNTKKIYVDGTLVLEGTLCTKDLDVATYTPDKVRVGQFKGGTTGIVFFDDVKTYYYTEQSN